MIYTRLLVLSLPLLLLSAAEAYSQTGAPSNPKPAQPAKQEDCGCDAKLPENVYAVVNGAQIAKAVVYDPLKEDIRKLEQTVIDARNRQLDAEINSIVLEREAKRRGMTVMRFVQEEIHLKISDPTDEDARTFYNDNRATITGEFNDLKADIIGYLRAEREKVGTENYAMRLRTGADVKILIDKVTPPENEAAKARVFATVSGEPITSAKIEDALRPVIFSVQDEIYKLLKDRLDVVINNTLLAQESSRRKITPKALLDAEITSKIKPPTLEEAQRFYEQNKYELPGTFEQMKGQIMQYLQEQQRRSVESAFAERLRKAAMIQLALQPPVSPLYAIAIDDQPVKGDPASPVTVVEFTDFECPSCAATQPIVEHLVDEYKGKVKLVVRDFPLDRHKNAIPAARAAEAAREQGKYWEYAALLFQNQKELDTDKLKEYASRIGLDRARFDSMLESPQTLEQVERDRRDAYTVGVDATPTLFVNGRRVRGITVEVIKEAIEAALKSK